LGNWNWHLVLAWLGLVDTKLLWLVFRVMYISSVNESTGASQFQMPWTGRMFLAFRNILSSRTSTLEWLHEEKSVNLWTLKVCASDSSGKKKRVFFFFWQWDRFLKGIDVVQGGNNFEFHFQLCGRRRLAQCTEKDWTLKPVLWAESIN
jgi:hypothetical protein